MADNRKPCCRDEKNLAVVEHVPGHVLVKKCRVCLCRHFRAFLQKPGDAPNVPIRPQPTEE